MKAARQHVLEEAAEELEGLKVDMSPGAGATVAKGPAQASIGQELELAVAGGGFEHVTAEVAQSVLAVAGDGASCDYLQVVVGGLPGVSARRTAGSLKISGTKANAKPAL
jgi:hypothetical protein